MKKKEDQELVVRQQQPDNASMVVSADQYGHIEARIRADAQVRATLALARPRDLDVVRERMLKDAARPGFAEVARYSVPRGKKKLDSGEWVQNYIKGPSIRFAESALRAMGNALVDVTILHESESVRSGEVTVGDLESNQLYRQGFTVPKVIERRQLPKFAKAEDVVGTRLGADGQTLYIMKASDADVLMLQNAITSKIIRNLALRLTPGDLVEDALAACESTLKKADAQDPAAARKKIADAFAGLNVSVESLKKHLGHGLEQCSPLELDDLRGIYSAISDGHITWGEVVKEAGGKEDTEPTGAEKAAVKVRERLSARKRTAQDPVVADAPAKPAADPTAALRDEWMRHCQDVVGMDEEDARSWWPEKWGVKWNTPMDADGIAAVRAFIIEDALRLEQSRERQPGED